jgi:hypothetical protein
MINHWLTTTFFGVCTGLALYACVRLRMQFGPIVKVCWGEWARRAYWMMTFLVMVILANVGLLLLRIYVPKLQVSADSLILEIWFCLVFVVVTLGLILNKFKKRI